MAFGDVGLQYEGVAVKMPADVDVAHGTLTPCEVADGMRGDGIAVAVSPDAEDIRDEQVIEVSHHEMVHRGAVLRVPLFGQRGVTEFDLIAIAWDVVVVEHLVQEFLLAVVDEGVEQVAVADVARGQAVAMAVDVSDKAVKDSLTVLLWHQAHFQSNGEGTLTAHYIPMCCGGVELTDEGSFDAVGAGLLHQVVPPVVVGSRYQRHGRIL